MAGDHNYVPEEKEEQDDDDGPLVLPSDTLQALQDFQSEKAAREKQFEDLKSQAEQKFDDGKSFSMDSFGEDWNVSQFWYADSTADLLARQILHGAGSESAIAVVSAPSVFVALKNILCLSPTSPKPRIVLLEFDRRFEVFGSDFYFYDFAAPLRLPAELKGQFDRIICDPPFLSEDCQTKTALTVRFLAKNWTSDGLAFVTCTGERMQSTILRLYDKLSIAVTDFEPQHRKGLSNEFRCYANFDCNDWHRKLT